MIVSGDGSVRPISDGGYIDGSEPAREGTRVLRSTRTPGEPVTALVPKAPQPVLRDIAPRAPDQPSGAGTTINAPPPDSARVGTDVTAPAAVPIARPVASVRDGAADVERIDVPGTRWVIAWLLAMAVAVMLFSRDDRAE